jgi:photosystem II stability/assembly factor-like uncharacterized protein
MRRKNEKTPRSPRGRTTASKAKKPKGGKVLRRLFAYLNQRDSALTQDVAARLAVAPKLQPKFTTPAPKPAAKSAARSAFGAGVAAVSKQAGASLAAQSFAGLIANAGAALCRVSTKKTAGVRAKKAGPAGALGTTWQFIGPSVVPNGQTYGTNEIAVIGRVGTIAVDPGNPKHLLLGAAGGGIWESKDTGSTWQPRGDQLPSLAIGAIAFDPANPQKVYAGSGEGNFYSNLGAGVFKSTDGGTNWTKQTPGPLLGVGFFDLVVDPANSTIIYGATTDGFFKSTNGGTSWSLKRAGTCWDISVHPNGGTTELLATFQDGLFGSADAGNSFQKVTLPSPPAGNWTRLGVDRVKSSPDIAYVFGAVESRPYLARRTGTTWKKITTPPLDPNDPWTIQAEYDWYVAVPPNNKNRVYLGAIDTVRGDLTGTTWHWTNITTQGGNSIHPDQHCLTFSPDDSKIIYAGSDGGIFRSANSGANWTPKNEGLGITEIEYIASDPNTSAWLMAGTQDNGTLRYTGSASWLQIGQGDGGDCGVNPLNPNEAYHTFYFNSDTGGLGFARSKDKGSTWTDIDPPLMNALFYPPVEVFGATVAIGATELIVSRDKAVNWESVPLGLAAREVSTAMREIDANTVLIGTNKGGMLKVSWDGTAWKKTRLTSLPVRYISCIAVDPSNPQRFWVTMSTAGGPSIFRSDDAGNAWVNCTNGLPATARALPMNAVVIDPANFKRAWVAADVGVYQTLDLGLNWTPFSIGLPNAMAVDLLLHKQDRVLFCATRNRGVWTISVP